MKASDKLKSDIDRSLAGIEKSPPSLRPAQARECASTALSFLPQTMLPSIAEAFEERYALDKEKAAAWLVGLAGIFSRDYDGGLVAKDWGQLKTFVEAGAGELDLEALTYAMNLILEHKAL
jgi:hypothetical protein